MMTMIIKQFKGKNIAYISPKDIINNIKTAIEIYEKNPKPNKKIIRNSNKTLKGVELIRSLIDNDNLRVPGEYYAKPLHNTNLSWMKDEEGYEETAGEADSDYMKGNNDNELKLIKDFITKINNGKINNKNNAASEFRKLKQKVMNDRLRQDLIKDLEKSLFGNDLENIEPEDNKKRTFALPSPPKEDYSAETNE